MGDIVTELSKTVVLGADIFVEGWSDCRNLQIVPVAISIRASSVIVSDDVIRVCDPNGRRRLVSVKQTPGAANIHNEVTFDQVLCLGSILNEDRVAHCVICNVVLDAKIVHAMDRHSSVECVMDGVVSYIRRMHCANHMEVDRVASENEGLTNVVKLNVVNTSGGGLIAGRVHDDDSSVLLVWRCLVTLILDIPRKQANLGSHLDEIVSEVLNACVVLEDQRFSKCNDRVSVNVRD